MSDLQVHVRSNLDALSAELLHDAFKNLVRDSVREMRDVARAATPKRTDLLVEHIKDDEVEAIADMIEGRLGVTAIPEADKGTPTDGQYRHSQYPLFVHGGTRTPIFPAKRSAMFNRDAGIIFRKQVRGQKPQPFMAEAYAQARAIIDTDPSVGLALKEMAARAAAELPAVMAE